MICKSPDVNIEVHKSTHTPSNYAVEYESPPGSLRTGIFLTSFSTSIGIQLAYKAYRKTPYALQILTFLVLRLHCREIGLHSTQLLPTLHSSLFLTICKASIAHKSTLVYISLAPIGLQIGIRGLRIRYYWNSLSSPCSFGCCIPPTNPSFFIR